jgi:hypothetical protein
MSKKPAVALRKPPPVVDPKLAEQFVRGGGVPPEAPAVSISGKVHGRGPRRSFITRSDGRELRRMTVYLPPELARRLAVYAAKTDSDISAAIASICDDFLARADG